MNWTFLKRLFRRGQPKVTVTVSGRTDTGKRRSRNEDCFSIMPNRHIFIVADGMGGHNAGHIASQCAVEAMAAYLLENRIDKMTGNQASIRHNLIAALRHANDTVIRKAACDESLKGMGCTLIGGFMDNTTLHTCHVGDVRGYIMDQRNIRQITRDHSYAAEGRGKGKNAKIPRNIVSRAVGFPFNEDPEYNSALCPVGSRILLCSDGLWSMLDDPSLLKITREAATPNLACETLVDAANEAGGRDNITAVVVFIE